MIVGAGVFLISNRSVLLVYQKQSGLWGIPKGHSNDRESIEDNWRRELREETGIDIRYINDVYNGGKTRYFDIGGPIRCGKYKIKMLEVIGDKPRCRIGDNHEIGVCEWVPVNEVMKRKVNLPTKLIMEYYSNTMKSE